LNPVPSGRSTILALLFALAPAILQDPHPATALEARPLPSPAPPGSRLPNLSTGPDSSIRLSWVIEEDLGSAGTKATLAVSRLSGDEWSKTATVSSGTNWFVNWTDFPSVVALNPKQLVAQFLERSGEGSYDYQVRITQSSDGGQTWTEPKRLHSHDGPGEHGFVTLLPLDAGKAAAVWLDGRHAGAHGEADEAGAMSLYTRTIDASGALGEEIALDERVCDCCPTAAVRARDGALVVAYRDRSEEEVRDISVVRIEADRLEKSSKKGSSIRPTWGSRDGWKIEGCPVNGPALAVEGDRIGLAWFTAAENGQGSVACVFSTDSGKSFSDPVRIAEEQVFGRVDAVFDDGGRLVVSWLEAGADRARWRVARVVPGASAPLDTFTVVDVDASRASGLARLARDEAGIVFAWTEFEKMPRVGLRRLVWE
jgi:hypothetical protein